MRFLAAQMRSVSLEKRQRLTWSIARLLRDGFAHLRFRRSVLADPVLEATLDEIITAPDGIAGFLALCESVPGCGGAQIENIRTALITEIRLQAHLAAAAGDTALAATLVALLERPNSLLERAPGPVTGQFLVDATAGMEDVIKRLWRQAPPERFFYLPASLPECAKTAAVIAAEAGADAPPVMGDRGLIGDLAGAKGGVILIDRQALEALRGRCGRYAALSDRDWREQMALLSDLGARLSPGIDIRVTDFARAGLHTAAILGERLVVPVPGGSAVFFAPPGLAEMIALIEAACSDARPLSAHLAETA